MAPIHISRFYSMAGDEDRTLYWLERTFAGGWPHLLEVPIDPLFEELRNDPRMRELERRYR